MGERNDLVPFEGEIGKQRKQHAVVSDDEMKELKATFPEPFVAHVRKHGWCSYADDLFWTISPRYLASGIADWKLDVQALAFAHNALGDVYAICRGEVVSLRASGTVLALQTDLVDFLNDRLGPTQLREADVTPLRRKFGPVEWDECYTYSPALPIQTDQIRKADKGKLLPYLSIIGQLVAPVAIAKKLGKENQPVGKLPPKLRKQLLSAAADAEKELAERKRKKGY